MKNLLAFAAALALAVAAAGWYLGWYNLRATPQSGGHESINIDVNTDKVRHDLREGEDEVIKKSKEHIEDLVDKGAQDFPAAPTAKQAAPEGLPALDGPEPRVPLNVPSAPR